MHHPVARVTRRLLLAVMVGVLAGLAAAGLRAGLHHGTPLLVGRFTDLGGPEVLRFRWELLLLPTLGGLASGILVQLIGRFPSGQGTDLLVRAFHRQDGDMRPAGPLTKGVAAIGVISCGGSAGPEGPIAAVGAAIGSSVGRWFHLTPRDRRVLLISGCAGGVGAIFGCPLGGALFGASVLYRQPEFESKSLVSALIASVVSYSTYVAFWGFESHVLRGADELAFRTPIELPAYLALGAFCGLAAIFFSLCLRSVERAADHMRAVPVWVRPALGGLLTGLLACALPQVMDGEYRMIQKALDGRLFGGLEDVPWAYWALLLALIALAKCVATAFTVGSGASGGLLGPSVFIGGAVGGFTGALLEVVFPGLFPEGLREAFIPVGMAGFLAAAFRTPLAAMVMVAEMTGSYGLIVPLMLVVMIAYLIGGRWGVVREQVASSTESPAHAGDTVVNMLEQHRVRDRMEWDWPFVAEPSTTLGELLSAMAGGDRPHFAVLKDKRLVGMISVADIRRLVDEEHIADAVIAADIMNEDLFMIDPDETLYEALNAIQQRGLEVLPVVVHGRERRLLGMISRETIYGMVKALLGQWREAVIHEHAGLAAIEQDSQLSQLYAGMGEPGLGRIERM
ncbi:MAG: chloride channel protein, partial [Phycisphaerales bacterium]